MSRWIWLCACLLGVGGCADDPSTWPFTLRSTVYPGPYRVTGTISLPADVESNGAAALTLTSADTSPYTTLAYVDEAAVFDLGTISVSIKYSVDGLAAGRYLVGCVVNDDGDRASSAGDLAGYYAGTPEEPLIRARDATVIEISNQSLDGADFGIGPVTCLAGYGDPCSEDADCGGTLCSYPETERVRGLHAGTCDAESGVCVEAPGECPALDGLAGTKSESGCFGAGPE